MNDIQTTLMQKVMPPVAWMAAGALLFYIVANEVSKGKRA